MAFPKAVNLAAWKAGLMVAHLAWSWVVEKVAWMVQRSAEKMAVLTASQRAGWSGTMWKRGGFCFP